MPIYSVQKCAETIEGRKNPCVLRSKYIVEGRNVTFKIFKVKFDIPVYIIYIKYIIESINIRIRSI